MALGVLIFCPASAGQSLSGIETLFGSGIDYHIVSPLIPLNKRQPNNGRNPGVGISGVDDPEVEAVRREASDTRPQDYSSCNPDNAPRGYKRMRFALLHVVEVSQKLDHSFMDECLGPVSADEGW